MILAPPPDAAGKVDMVAFEHPRQDEPPQDGWQPPAEYPESADSGPDHAPPSAAKLEPKPQKPAFVLYADLSATSSKTWLVKDMLGTGEMSAWYGAPGCGKGVIVEDLCLHIAAGIDWHGRTTTQGAVVYIALERKRLVERRAIAFREKHGLQNLPFAIVGGVYDFRQAQTADQIAAISRQVELATGSPVVLIIIDTVSRALTGGDENGPKDMGALVSTCGRIQDICPDAHITLIHHIPHDSERLRGHGALLGAIDTSVSVSNAGAVRTATVVKVNDGIEGERVAFTIEGVTIHPDGTTAPVAVPASSGAASMPGKKRKLSDKARNALDALAETITTHGMPAPSTFGLPAGIRMATLDQWFDELCDRNILDRAETNRWRDFGRLRDSLVARRAIGVRNKSAWIAAQH